MSGFAIGDRVYLPHTRESGTVVRLEVFEETGDDDVYFALDGSGTVLRYFATAFELLRAYRVETQGFPEADGVVVHTSRSRARWAVVRSYCEAFDAEPRDALRRIRLRRAPEFDDVELEPGRFVGIDCLEGLGL